MVCCGKTLIIRWKHALPETFNACANGISERVNGTCKHLKDVQETVGEVDHGSSKSHGCLVVSIAPTDQTSTSGMSSHAVDEICNKCHN